MFERFTLGVLAASHETLGRWFWGSSLLLVPHVSQVSPSCLTLVSPLVLVMGAVLGRKIPSQYLTLDTGDTGRKKNRDPTLPATLQDDEDETTISITSKKVKKSKSLQRIASKQRNRLHTKIIPTSLDLKMCAWENQCLTDT